MIIRFETKPLWRYCISCHLIERELKENSLAIYISRLVSLGRRTLHVSTQIFQPLLEEAEQ